jgi:pimeloyl-ACP methyl ester carboxylesterase
LKISSFLDEPQTNPARIVTRPAVLILAASLSHWSRPFVTILGLTAGGALFVFFLVIEWGAWALVHPGRRSAPSALEPPTWERIEVTADDGTRLVGGWHAGTESRGRTAILLHGFAEEHTALLGRAEVLMQAGWNVALPDSRARGRSEGKWTTFGGLEAGDLRRWTDLLQDRVGPEFTVAAWGRSMGAAIALRAAAEDPRISALVLEAPYPDLRLTVVASLGRLRIPPFFAGLILRRAERLTGIRIASPRPVDLAEHVRVPVLLIHGANDPIVPSAAVRRLAEAFPTPPAVIEVPGAGHADIFDTGGPELAAKLVDFLSRTSKSSEYSGF